MGEFPKSPLAFNDQKELDSLSRSTRCIDTNCFPIQGLRDFNLSDNAMPSKVIAHNTWLSTKIH